MRRPAPADPPMIETTRLGVIAIDLVIKFLVHFFILRSKNPWWREWPRKLQDRLERFQIKTSNIEDDLTNEASG